MKTLKILIAVLFVSITTSCKKDQPEVIDPAIVATPEFIVEIWDENKAFNGKTLFTFDDDVNHRIIEVNMDGSVAWEYVVSGSNQLVDAEYLQNGNILFGVKGEGVYEVDRNKNIVWSFIDNTVWHDADRLDNGNTLITCCEGEAISPYPYVGMPQVKEVNPAGTEVWTWEARDHYLLTPYDTGYGGAGIKYSASEWRGDWTHVNGAERLTNGNTMISVRNFDLVIIVDSNGDIIQEIGTGDPDEPPVYNTLGLPDNPHNPVLLYDDVSLFSGAWWDEGDILVSIPWLGGAIVLDTATVTVKWQWPAGGWQTYGEMVFVRDAKPLPNGNILMNDASGRLIEVTQSGEIVWLMKIQSYPLVTQASDYMANYMVFFKAERSGCGWNLGW
ncbi:aryl-sulfate sulfotransferase [Crocinitomix catalasitica]|nr:aryl-sulfate sulfotransferase [Crocinitomix catalasitica]